MLNILTVHHRTPKWIDIQLDFLRRHLTEPHTTFACIEGIDEADAAGFDVTVQALGAHAGKLNYMAAIASRGAREDDLLMFLDGDAFPIADPMPTVRRALSSTDLVAVRRDENIGDRQPHPCFAVTTVSTWKRIHGDWSQGHPWTVGPSGKAVSDVGGNLLYLLESTSTSWTPLLRTNRRDLHPLFFGVYGDVVYHHGAGFRTPFARLDASRNPYGRTRGPARIRWRRQRESRNQLLSERVYQQIKEDPHFYRHVCGVDAR